MKCDLCKNEYNTQKFNSFRRYDGDYIDKKIDLCNDCTNEVMETDKFEKMIQNGFKLYEISRCSCYNDCEKIGNLRMKCEEASEVGNSSPWFKYPIKAINWCEPGEAGIIRASVKLYELFENYDKNSTKLSNNMLNYTKNMHHLTWLILGFTVISAILTIINLWIAYNTI